jgi:hypothetical protein
MKRLLFLLLIPFIFGCESYIEPDIPHLSGGVWTFYDYDVITMTSSTLIYESDTICIGGLNYRLTPIDKRFIKNQTKWEFDDNGFSLYCDINDTIQSRIRFEVTYPPYTIDEIMINNLTYTYIIAINSTYPSRLALLSPPFKTNLYFINGNEVKGVNVQILLKFMRE